MSEREKEETMLEGKTIKSVEKDSQYGGVVLTTEDGTVAVFGTDTPEGDLKGFPVVTLHVDGETVFGRPVADEPYGS